MLAVVDDLFKRREPQRQAAGIYFVTPSPASIAKIVEDWQVSNRPHCLCGSWIHSSEHEHICIVTLMPADCAKQRRGDARPCHSAVCRTLCVSHEHGFGLPSCL